MAKKINRRGTGFTLIEVIVAMSISLMLGLAVVGIFIFSQRSVANAADTVEMVQTTRPVLNRLTSYLASAVTLVGEDDTVVYPPLNAGYDTELGDNPVAEEPDTWTGYLVFRTTEDFLSTTFNPDEIWEVADAGIDSLNHKNIMNTLDSDRHAVYDYIVWWEDDVLDKLPDQDNVLVIARLTRLIDAGDGNKTILRPSDDYRLDLGNDPWDLLDDTFEPRFLGHRLERVSFHRLVSNGVYVSLLARKATLDAKGGQINKEFRSEAMIQIPSFAMQQQ